MIHKANMSAGITVNVSRWHGGRSGKTTNTPARYAIGVFRFHAMLRGRTLKTYFHGMTRYPASPSNRKRRVCSNRSSITHKTSGITLVPIATIPWRQLPKLKRRGSIYGSWKELKSYWHTKLTSSEESCISGAQSLRSRLPWWKSQRARENQGLQSSKSSSHSTVLIT